MRLAYTDAPWPLGTPARSLGTQVREARPCFVPVPVPGMWRSRNPLRAGTQMLSPSPQCLVQGRAPRELSLRSEVPNKGFAVAPGCCPVRVMQGNGGGSLTLELHSPKFKAQRCCLSHFGSRALLVP